MKSLPNMTMKQTRSIIPYNLGLALCYALEEEILNIEPSKTNQLYFQ